MSHRVVTTTMVHTFNLRPGESAEDGLERFMRETFPNVRPVVTSVYTHVNIPPMQEQTCDGCIHDEPGQLAHMQPGGCLYMSPPQTPAQQQWSMSNSQSSSL